jgi:Domain of unknown function (DUF397)
MNAVWAKSSLSFSNGNCVEVTELPGGAVGVRNSRNPGGPVLRFSRDEWDAFLGGARLGEFDRFGTQMSRLSIRAWYSGRQSAATARPPLATRPALRAEAVEFAVSYAAEESVPLRRREPQDRSCGVPAVAHANRATGQARHLDAVAVGVTQRALDPVRTWSRPFEWTCE